MHDVEVVVPDLASQRRERIPYVPEDQHVPEDQRFRLEAGGWIETGLFADADQVIAPPFEAISLDLEAFWIPRQSGSWSA